MSWMQAHPHELKFVLGFFHSPCWHGRCAAGSGETLRFLPRLLARGQASGELMRAPPS